jgi:hypothetical protein
METKYTINSLAAGTQAIDFGSYRNGSAGCASLWRSTVQIRKPTMFRNALDLRDKVQVRVLRRRLKLSAPELGTIVRKTGNSLAAITKEAAATRPR